VIELRAPSPDATHAVAGAVAELARAGDLVVLAGEMGAGKTWFAKGFAAALGVTDDVTSPTFTLVHSYHGGRIALHHADVYRLDRLSEVTDLALSELLEEDDQLHGGVVLVEWGDAVAPLFGNDFLEVRLWSQPDAPETERHISLRPVGKRWTTRWDELLARVKAWTC